jgi:hypothetical protein
LRAYARHGQSLHIDCVDKAEKAIIDTMQSANVPRVCNTEGAAILHREFCGRALSARARAVLDAADEQEINTGVPPTEPADTSPLTPASCVGRRVLVPHSIYPTYPCDEFDGRGWEARIIAYSKRDGYATATYLHACDARGLPYQDVLLALAVLTPI